MGSRRVYIILERSEYSEIDDGLARFSVWPPLSVVGTGGVGTGYVVRERMLCLVVSDLGFH
jgi:hypothetical protein